MDDIHSKFIVIDDPEDGLCLVFGRVTFHKQLLWNYEEDKQYVLGGGKWELKDGHKTLVLTDESCDFGRCEEPTIQKVLNEGSVYATYIGGRSLDITKIIFENEFKQIVIFNKN
ncbi:hypothetical protein [Methanoculleus sp.]|uniref:hypothetical protein n=1 Tax=Methanoculleus sp. TaxID=90427 RepID=UPI0025F18AE4|nr:hypothetical protein [Methanoculleus sp.]MCK9320169.1 hypothetical protein [Methanoculleus sp.]